MKNIRYYKIIYLDIVWIKENVFITCKLNNGLLIRTTYFISIKL